MKAYIIHKSGDRPTVIQCVQEIQAKCDKLEALILESVPQKVWKKQAGKKIAEADCAIFFVGADKLQRCGKCVGGAVRLEQG